MMPSLCAAFTGGQEEAVLEARSVLDLVRVLDARFPGLGELLESRASLAVDGEIVRDWTVALRPDSEVFLVPRIAGG
jgi:molybdopterin converting factor small subunit